MTTINVKRVKTADDLKREIEDKQVEGWQFVKRVKTADDLKREIEDKQVKGWQLNSQSDNVAVMTKPGKYGNFWVHVIILAFTWWTFGICNAVYAYYMMEKTKAELHIKVEY